LGHLKYTHEINVIFHREFHEESTTPIIHIYPWDKNKLYINPPGEINKRNYGETHAKNISIFVKIMQELYLQNPDLFEKMVEDYYAIKETVHDITQQVYHDIIDGVYEQTTPVIK
jgi:hypothetical protein